MVRAVIERLRTVGLTIREIQELVRVYEPRRGGRTRTRSAAGACEGRTDAQIGELQAPQRRILAYRREKGGALGTKLAAGAIIVQASSQ